MRVVPFQDCAMRSGRVSTWNAIDHRYGLTIDGIKSTDTNQ